MTRFLSTNKYSKTTTNSTRLKPVSPTGLRLKRSVDFVSSNSPFFQAAHSARQNGFTYSMHGTSGFAYCSLRRYYHGSFVETAAAVACSDASSSRDISFSRKSLGDLDL